MTVRTLLVPLLSYTVSLLLLSAAGSAAGAQEVGQLRTWEDLVREFQPNESIPFLVVAIGFGAGIGAAAGSQVATYQDYFVEPLPVEPVSVEGGPTRGGR